jgi:predicted outer membrane repeat protein
VTAHHLVELDGFVIRDGNATGAGVPRAGGVYGEVVISGSLGQGPTILLARCSFVGNRGPNRGGALYAQLAYVVLESCSFIGNLSDRGGALCTNAATTEVYNCKFIGNHARQRGGAVFFYSDNGDPPRNRFSNCLFAHNEADEGGAVYLLGTNVTCGNAMWVNCTFSSNNALTQGGAILAHDGPSTLSDPVNEIKNCIIWGNTAPLDPNVSGLARPETSIIEGWVLGPPSVFSLDPLFANPAIDDYRLRAGSPALDIGDATLLRPDVPDLDGDGIINEPVPYDLDGRPRTVDDPTSPFGIPPFLDLGAYER